MKKPLPCPFCVYLYWRFVRDPVTYATHVECVTCGARSPRRIDEDAVLAAWSERAL